MKGNIGKGTDVFKFFSMFFKLCGDFWLVESNESYWESLMNESDKMLADFKKCDFYLFARALVLVLNVYLSDIKYKHKGEVEGRWHITFEPRKENQNE